MVKAPSRDADVLNGAGGAIGRLRYSIHLDPEALLEAPS
jgi:hypothetical protein